MAKLSGVTGGSRGLGATADALPENQGWQATRRTQLFVVLVLAFLATGSPLSGPAMMTVEEATDEALSGSKEAVSALLFHAEQGHASAQSNLGLMYDNGEGVPEDDAEAVRWYRLAAEQGLAEAQSNLGFMYDKGEGGDERAAARCRHLESAGMAGTRECPRPGSMIAGQRDRRIARRSG